MQRERLLELRKVLERVPEEQFDINNWFVVDRDCNTAGCALGWACRHLPFVAEGLHLNEDDEPELGSSAGYTAGRNFFELTDDQATRLFDPASYLGAHEGWDWENYRRPKGKATTEDVIARIDSLLLETSA